MVFDVKNMPRRKKINAKTKGEMLKRSRKDKLEKPKKFSLKVKVKKPTVHKAKSKKTVHEHEEKLTTTAVAKEETRKSRVFYDMEHGKRMIMWSGVTFFMILILTVWIYNTSKIFQQTKISDNGGGFDLSDWDSLTNELGDRINQMSKGLEELESFSKASSSSEVGLPNSELSNESLSSTTVSTTTTKAEKGQEELNDLKRRVEELGNNISE